MAKDPKNRYRSVESLIGAIESLLPATTVSRALTPVVGVPRSPPRTCSPFGRKHRSSAITHALDGRRRGPGRFDRTGPVGRVDALSALDVLERKKSRHEKRHPRAAEHADDEGDDGAAAAPRRKVLCPSARTARNSE